MKKLLLSLCLIIFSSYAFAQEPVVLEDENTQEEIHVEQSIDIIKEILDTDLDNVFYEIEISDEEEYLEEETITQKPEEIIENAFSRDFGIVILVLVNGFEEFANSFAEK